MEQEKNNAVQLAQQTLLNTLKTWQPKQSLSVALALDQPAIALLRKHDKQTTKEKIILIVTSCVGLVNVERNMNAFQIDMCADMIMEKQWMYSLEDIQIALQNGACGMYGEIYNRVDISVVFSWLAKYEQDRQRVVMEKKRKELEQNNIYEVFQSDVMRDALKMVVDKLPKVEDKPEPPRTKPSEFEQMVMDEWDKIPYEKGTRLKHCFELLMDFEDYRKWRVSEELDKLEAEKNETTNNQ